MTNQTRPIFRFASYLIIVISLLSFGSAKQSNNNRSVSRYHVGSELWIADLIALRGGYKFFYDTEDWTIGGGLKLKLGHRKMMINIAYSNFAEYFTPPLRISIGGSF